MPTDIRAESEAHPHTFHSSLTRSVIHKSEQSWLPEIGGGDDGGGGIALLKERRVWNGNYKWKGKGGEAEVKPPLLLLTFLRFALSARKMSQI